MVDIISVWLTNSLSSFGRYFSTQGSEEEFFCDPDWTSRIDPDSTPKLRYFIHGNWICLFPCFWLQLLMLLFGFPFGKTTLLNCYWPFPNSFQLLMDILGGGEIDYKGQVISNTLRMLFGPWTMTCFRFRYLFKSSYDVILASRMDYLFV